MSRLVALYLPLVANYFKETEAYAFGLAYILCTIFAFEVACNRMIVKKLEKKIDNG